MPSAHPNSRPSSHRLPLLKACAAAGALFGVTLLAYGPALSGAPLWDDDAHITAPALQTPAGLWRIWSSPGATQQYYPVLHSAFWLEHRLWGDSVLGYHLANVLFHSTAACLAAFVLARLRRGRGAPALPGAGDWLAAAVFALHPVCVESVAWISEQKNTLSLVFYLLSALAYLRFERERTLKHYLPAVGLFVLALLSKSVTATLPAALLLMVAWRRGSLRWRRDVIPLAPWFVLGIVAGLFTAWVERHFVGANAQTYSLSYFERLVLAGRVVWFYLGKLLWPADLSFIYPHWSVTAGLGWILALVALVGLGAALWRLRRWSGAPLLAFLFFVGSLFPALGFFYVYPFQFSYVADHWQYLPCLGIIALLAEGGSAAAHALVSRETAKRKSWAILGCGTLAGLLLIALFTLSRRQAALYRDAPTLYRDTLRKNPECWMAHGNLGVSLMNSGALDEAIGHFSSALRIRPDYADAHINLGIALSREPGRMAEAVREFQAALALNPGMAEAHASLGSALVQLPGRTQEGIAEMEAALRGNENYPGFAALHRDLGAALATVPGRLAPAQGEEEKALELDPGLVSARIVLGKVLAREGRPDEAVRQFERALQAQPNDAAVQEAVANGLALLGRNPEAISHYRTALRLRPDSAETHFFLGRALRDMGDGSEAIAEYHEALRLGPDSAELRNSLGSVLFRVGRPLEAADEYERAVQFEPGSAVYLRNLGTALTGAGRLDEAISALRRALSLNPGDADAHYCLGTALKRAGRGADADAEFEAAGRKEP